MEIRRFGPGHRRPDGPPGTQGVTGQVIHSDARGVISELAFGRSAMIAPHTNQNTALFVVISGGGFVQVGSERERINHGEAVLWPAGEPHGAYTDGTDMRAIVVEFAGADDDWARGILDSVLLEAGQRNEGRPLQPVQQVQQVQKATGSLADKMPPPEEQVTPTGEPW